MWEISVSILKIPLPSPLMIINVYSVYIDQVGFELRCTFHDNPTTRPTPAFLFSSPLQTECVNDMTCVRFPFSKSRFYWSEGPDGNTIIPKDKWERFGVPNLKLKTYVGSFWKNENYACVRDLVGSRGYCLDGEQYARDHGHPELIFGEPHTPLVKLISLTINL